MKSRTLAMAMVALTGIGGGAFLARSVTFGHTSSVADLFIPRRNSHSRPPRSKAAHSKAASGGVGSRTMFFRRSRRPSGPGGPGGPPPAPPSPTQPDQE